MDTTGKYALFEQAMDVYRYLSSLATRCPSECFRGDVEPRETLKTSFLWEPLAKSKHYFHILPINFRSTLAVSETTLENADLGTKIVQSKVVVSESVAGQSDHSFTHLFETFVP
ncbi:hypothetical protein C8J56DRAFT_1059084 [Mycena floridula]|nr:hypothetical protein C8J56DRAFT_1059084 [Mycena floridula]